MLGGSELHQGSPARIRTKIVQTLLPMRLVQNLVKPSLIAKLLCHAKWHSTIKPICIYIPCRRLPLHVSDAQTLALERDSPEQARTDVLIAVRGSDE